MLGFRNERCRQRPGGIGLLLWRDPGSDARRLRGEVVSYKWVQVGARSIFPEQKGVKEGDRCKEGGLSALKMGTLHLLVPA